ncbi:MAG: hypothetical protein JWM27_1314 [Gemmatimonadetes bacterium]|nr:hypothetical protein [Gemmatimonadota bacterium]
MFPGGIIMAGESPGEGVGVAFGQVRGMALALPGVEEGTSYGTPALRVRGRFFLRLKEDGGTRVLKSDLY